MDFNCVICLENIINYNDKKTLDCEHMFHKECINKIVNNKCPLCNHQIIDDKLKEYENLYLEICQQLHSSKLENKELKEIIDSDTILQDIDNSIAKSISINNYKKDIKTHYNIKKSLIPFHCKYCNFKTGKFGNIYNHINDNHNDKLKIQSDTEFRFAFGNVRLEMNLFNTSSHSFV
jgi:hypothetical protein